MEHTGWIEGGEGREREMVKSVHIEGGKNHQRACP